MRQSPFHEANPALDFSKNRAEGDDILGDAYEYLMRHFATESGKSKGQFYTPAEVSRKFLASATPGPVATLPYTTQPAAPALSC
jgi:type I restriction enzyme M protein